MVHILCREVTNIARRMKRDGEAETHLLGRGIPCVKHACVQCCIETEMPLSRLDIKRILKLGYRLKDFAVKTGNGWRLRNRSGRCIFLSEGGCKIYSFRPEGCRLYPLVYDENIQKAVIDHTCPYGYEFEVGKDDVKELRILLERLEKETRAKRKT